MDTSRPRLTEPAGSTPPSGLSQREAAARLAEVGPNVVAAARRVRLWRRVATQLRDPLILVLLAAVTLTVAIQDHPDAVVIALVIVVNTTVGVVQEVRADHAIEALTALSAPTARVVRDGTERHIPSSEVAPGDLVIVAEGDIVPADVNAREASALLVDESSLTGESVPVEKSAAETGDRELRAGTVVVHGRALGEVTATGQASGIGQIAALLRPKPEATPLQRRLAALGRVLAVVTLGLCLIVFAIGLARGETLEVMAVTAISLAVAAVPESLPAVVTLSLALGARRMAARNAVVRRLPAVETLGSVTVLATDKTGTVTEGVMLVESVWTPHARATFSGTGYRPEGESRVRAEGRDERRAGDEVRAVLVAASLCNDAALGRPAGPGEPWTALGDPTEAALLAAAAKAGLDTDALRRERPRLAEVPFDSERRRMATLHQGTNKGVEVEVNLKGAPEVVLGASVLDVEPELLTAARREAERLAAEGYRVLAVARGSLRRVPEPPELAEHGLRLLGLVGLYDPPKVAAAETLGGCRRAGITPVLITGDHPATAAAIARRLGILVTRDTSNEPVMTGDHLRATGVADVTRVRVFARTDPRQKVDIVQAWRARGEIAAMTGDGVNDGPALRQADIGVAMGHRGTEVARQAADLVLADDDIGTVVAAVEEGRRVYDNIRRFLLFGMSGGAAEIAVMLLGPAFGLTLPLRAGQILWINLLTHGLTGVAIGAEPVSPDAMRRPPRPPREHVLGDGLWARVIIVGALITAMSLLAGWWGHASARRWQSVLFLSLLTAQLGVCLGQRDRWWTRANPWLPVAVLVSFGLGLAAVYLPLLRDLLLTHALTPLELLPALLTAAIGGVLGHVTRPHTTKLAGRRDAPTTEPPDDRTPDDRVPDDRTPDDR